jgi:phosphomannomutase
MPLIKSISGIRGTIGGVQGENLTPMDIVKFTAAFVRVIQQKRNAEKICIVVGRDARKSGQMVNNLVCGTLMSMGADVIDVGLSTTPTVEMEVVHHKADGGIIITASHNPAQWNALKLLNATGEFFSAQDGELVLQFSEDIQIPFAEIAKIGVYTECDNAIERHIEKIVALPLVDTKAIAEARFKVAIDCVNSTGGIALPKLLKTLGVKEIHPLYCTPNGDFPHNPEPLPEHLTDISNYIKQQGIDVGFVVDPDVDRLAIVKENGEMFGEEYTLVAVADYILQHTTGNTVSNLSSTRALKVITEQYSSPCHSRAGGNPPNTCEYFAAAVGEVNVVEKMKECKAVIGGEGNGGIIYPELHCGRDALVGIALFLTYLAKSKLSVSQLRNKYPDFYISKNKIELNPDVDTDALFACIKEKYKQQPIIDIDGIRIDFENEWVQLRKSNTEPIIRIYAESDTMQKADGLAKRIVNELIKN